MVAIPDSVTDGHLGLSKERALLLQLLREEESRKSNGIVRRSRAAGEHLPLSWSQQRLWFIDQLEGELPAIRLLLLFAVLGSASTSPPLR